MRGVGGVTPWATGTSEGGAAVALIFGPVGAGSGVGASAAVPWVTPTVGCNGGDRPTNRTEWGDGGPGNWAIGAAEGETAAIATFGPVGAGSGVGGSPGVGGRRGCCVSQSLTKEPEPCARIENGSIASGSPVLENVSTLPRG